LAQQVFAEPTQFDKALIDLQRNYQQFAVIPDNLKDLISQEITTHLDDIFLMLCPQSVTVAPASQGVLPP
jgi:hypothetical protein